MLFVRRSIDMTPSLQQFYLFYFVLGTTTITTLLRGAQIDFPMERHSVF